MGVAASQMERKGIRTERSNLNRAIAISNQQLAQQRARVRKIKDWIISQPIQDAPTIGEMMSAINASQNTKSQWQKIRNIKRQAELLIFLKRNRFSFYN